MYTCQHVGNFKMSIQRKTPLKHVVDTPFQLKWPSIDEKCAQNTINLLIECLSDIKCSKLKFKEDELLKDVNKKSHLVIGINAVTRCLERGKMRGGVVCLSAKPPLLTSHLLILSATRKCPVMALNNLSSKLAPLLGINSVLALGFKTLSEDCTVDPFSKIINHLVISTPTSDIPWLLTSTAKEKEDDGKESCEPPHEKRFKQETKTKDEDTGESIDKQYYTLQIKTVTINKKEK